MQMTRRRAFQTGNTASAMALRSEKVWCIRKELKRLSWLEHNEQGRKGYEMKLKETGAHPCGPAAFGFYSKGSDKRF